MAFIFDNSTNTITDDTGAAPILGATGTAGDVLTSNGAGAAPTMQTPAGGGPTLFAENAPAWAVAPSATGNSSVAIGDGASASGHYAVSIGKQSQALSNYSAALGNSARARADSSLSLGRMAIAIMPNQIAFATGQSGYTGFRKVDLRTHLEGTTSGTIQKTLKTAGSVVAILEKGTFFLATVCVVARSTTGVFRSFKGTVALEASTTGATTIVGTGASPTASYAQALTPMGGTGGVDLGWTAEVVPSSNNYVAGIYHGGLTVNVAGSSGLSINWFATVEILGV